MFFSLIVFVKYFYSLKYDHSKSFDTIVWDRIDQEIVESIEFA